MIFKSTNQKESFNKMLLGKVKNFDNSRGYGFVKLENGEDCFVHVSVVQAAGLAGLSPGDRVNVEVEKAPKGLKAVKVEFAD
jgi:cold shock protein